MTTRLFTNVSYLDILKNADRQAILNLRQEKERWLGLGKKGVERFRKPCESVSHLQARYLDLSGDVVKIGRKEELSNSDYQSSERKWNRVVPALPDLRGKVVADIGCSNGYYMFRMAHHQPKLVLGFEPYLQHYFAFKTLNGFAGQDNLAIELLGVEHIELFKECFDVVFLMGILYHRSSPIDTLRGIREAMKPGATLIVESQGIPGDEPVALFPEKRYAKVPGTYFVPTSACLANWLSRAGYGEVEIFHSHPMSSEEQRQTEWMEFESYADFIDKQNPTLTVEGYPAPIRVFFKALNP